MADTTSPRLIGTEGRPIRVYLNAPDRAALFQQAFHDGVLVGPDGTNEFIALSGDGSNGAFTAGQMKGWTETCALAAPFVFLGSDYDDEIEEAYIGGAPPTCCSPKDSARCLDRAFTEADLRRAVMAANVPSNGDPDTG